MLSSCKPTFPTKPFCSPLKKKRGNSSVMTALRVRQLLLQMVRQSKSLLPLLPFYYHLYLRVKDLSRWMFSLFNVETAENYAEKASRRGRQILPGRKRGTAHHCWTAPKPKNNPRLYSTFKQPSHSHTESYKNYEAQQPTELGTQPPVNPATVKKERKKFDPLPGPLSQLLPQLMAVTLVAPIPLNSSR